MYLTTQEALDEIILWLGNLHRAEVVEKDDQIRRLLRERQRTAFITACRLIEGTGEQHDIAALYAALKRSWPGNPDDQGG